MMVRLDRSSLVMQVRNDLRRQVANGELKSGERLPGELQCADAYGVSRATVREAFMLLEQEGLVRVRRGHGRYVQPHARQHLTGSVAIFGSMTDFLESQGYVVSTRLVDLQTRRATPEEATALNLPEGAEVVSLTRFRLGDGVPLVYSIALFDSRLVVGQADGMDWSGSVMSFMRSKGFSVNSTLADVKAVTLPSEITQPHGLDACTAWLLLTAIQFDERGQPFLLSHDYVRGDVRTLHIVQRMER
jgi:GntR family transcriptional regulator